MEAAEPGAPAEEAAVGFGVGEEGVKAPAPELDSELRLERLRGARSSSCSMAGPRDEAEPEREMVLPESWDCC